MEMRSEVEKAFQRQVPDENGLAAREKFAQMLEALGLSSDEAVLLLNECDPASMSRLPYRDFLDFIFGPNPNEATQQKEEKVSTVYPTTEADTADQKAASKESVKATEANGDAPANSLRELQDAPPPNDRDIVENGNPRQESKESQDVIIPNIPKCARAGCPRQKNGSSKYCSLECMDEDAMAALSKNAKKIKVCAKHLAENCVQCHALGFEEIAASDDGRGKPPGGTATPDGSDKESVATIISNSLVTAKPTAGNRRCHMCTEQVAPNDVFEDPTDNYMYCERCWINWYGSPPCRNGPALTIPKKLVSVVQGKLWAEDKLLIAWSQHSIPGWPPGPAPTRAVTRDGDPTSIGDTWAPVLVRLNPGLIGSHARTCTQSTERPHVGEVLCNRYRIEEVVGAGHFTRALLANDMNTGNQVCVKKHNNITVELLTDLLTVGHRLQSVDPDGNFFPRVFEAFYDIDGYTVESLIVGKNCLVMGRDDPSHFQNFDNLRVVASGGLQGLVHMATAGVVHCDLKPDNIMWIPPNETNKEPSVRLVDFGCSRLDSRIENGRNWSLAEGGAGHVGKWAPEMVLRLRITHKADVWGLAVSLLELHCSRATWSGESDTVEVILAQVLGLVNARNGLPVDLLRRSPLDIRQLYTPHPSYFPVQRYGTFGQGARFQELRPATWGLGCVLGPEENWDEIRTIFSSFITASMTLDHEKRPPAEEMLTHAFIIMDKYQPPAP